MQVFLHNSLENEQHEFVLSKHIRKGSIHLAVIVKVFYTALNVQRTLPYADTIKKTDKLISLIYPLFHHHCTNKDTYHAREMRRGT